VDWSGLDYRVARTFPAALGRSGIIECRVSRTYLVVVVVVVRVFRAFALALASQCEERSVRQPPHTRTVDLVFFILYCLRVYTLFFGETEGGAHATSERA